MDTAMEVRDPEEVRVEEHRGPGRIARDPQAPMSLSAAEAAQRLGINSRWLIERLGLGIIPGFRLDRKSDWRITNETFDKIVAGEYNEAPSVSDLRQG